MTLGHRDDAHARRDDEKLRLHELVARELERDPERVLAIARDNLRRWMGSGGEQPHYREWSEILRTRSVAEVSALIVADTEEGRRLRQTSPFAGVVSRRERDAIFPRRGI